MYTYHYSVKPHRMHSLGTLWEYVRQWFVNLGNVNKALRGGKALELLQQKLIGRHGICDITLSGSDRRDGDELEITIQLERYAPLTEVAKLEIGHQIDAINERFDAKLHVRSWVHTQLEIGRRDAK